MAKFRKKSKAFTHNKKLLTIVGEWTKASHKRLMIDRVEKDMIKKGKLEL